MDPLSAASLAVNAIQLVAYTTKLSYSLRSSNELKDIKATLAEQSLLLQDTIRMIIGHDKEAHGLSDALDNPSSSYWANPELGKALRVRLGDDAYNDFQSFMVRSLETIRALLKEVQKLEKRTGLQRMLKPNNSCVSELLFALQANSQYLRLFLTTYVHNENLKKITDIQNDIKTEVQESQLNRVTEDLRQLLEQQTLAHETSADRDNGISDVDSVYTVASETESEESSLSFLPLSIRRVDSTSAVRLWEEALLDTGASACAISLDVAQRLELDIEDDPSVTTVRTVALDQNLAVKGKTQITLRWKDGEGNKYGSKTWVYVVFGLSKPILLSHDFTRNHPEVWQIAKTVAYRLQDEINLTFFPKLSKEDQKDQDKFTEEQSRDNKARAEEKTRQKLKELVDRLQKNNRDRSAASTGPSDTGSQLSTS